MKGPVRRRLGLRRALTVAVVAALSAAAPTAAPAEEPGSEDLYLVTLEGPGTAGDDSASADRLAGSRLRAEQEAVLAGVGAPAPVYSWTTALNGVAVRLSPAQADRLAADPRVALVEPNAVRPVAGRAVTTGVLGASARTHGGAGVVVGVVDSGLWPCWRGLRRVTTGRVVVPPEREG